MNIIQKPSDPNFQTVAMPMESPLVYLSTHYIRAKEYLEAIVASTSDAIWTTNMQGKVIFFSPGAERMLGISASEIVGLPIQQIFEEGQLEAKKIMKMLLANESFSDHTMVIVGKGKRVHVSMSGAFLKDKNKKRIGTLGISKDISERVELERRLRELSITDNLTGLFNQRHFHEKAQAEMLRARRQRSKLSLILIDLDHFKTVNDSLGHLEGDRILRRLADTIKRCIRGEVDAAFRYGGDEFLVLLPGSSHRRAEVVARRIQESFSVPSDKTLSSFSYGVSCMRGHDTINDLLHRADERMYQAKKNRNGLK